MAFDIPSTVLLIADAISIGFNDIDPPWGIYLGGIQIVPAKSVLSFEFKNSFAIADYQIENGGFQSYDKVNTPFDVRFQFTSGSSPFERQNFLTAMRIVANSLQLYDVVTPDAIYQSVNVSHWNYRRTATNGLGRIIADVWATEIRINASPQFIDTKAPSGASPQSEGQVQPTAPTGNQQAAASGEPLKITVNPMPNP